MDKGFEITPPLLEVKTSFSDNIGLLGVKENVGISIILDEKERLQVFGITGPWILKQLPQYQLTTKGIVIVPRFYGQYLLNLLGSLKIKYTVDDKAYKSIVEISNYYSKQVLEQNIDPSIVNYHTEYAPIMAHQKQAAYWLAHHHRCILADDMGIGKTLAAIVAANDVLTREGKQKVLIVTPASSKFQWYKEIEKFMPALLDKIIIIDAKNKSHPAAIREQQWRSEYPIKLVNYETLRVDIDLVKKCFQPDIMIIDEGHRIRNFRAKQSKAILALAKNTKYRWALTGTPLYNRPEDLYNLMRFVAYQVLGQYYKFRDFYTTYDYWGKTTGYKNLELLKQFTKPFIMRRLKEDIISLPPKTEVIKEISLELAHYRYYQQVLESNKDNTPPDNCYSLNLQAACDSKLGDGVINMLAKITYLRETANAAQLVFPNASCGAAKIDEIINILNEMDVKRKIVVFSFFKQMLDLIASRLTKENIGWSMLSGSVPQHKRFDLQEEFKNSDKRVFLMTTAGGEAINLQFCDTIIFCDIPWAPGAIKQITDRLHRIGQTKNVTVIKLFAVDTIDHQIYEYIEDKKKQIGKVTSDEVGLSEKELIDIAHKFLVKK